jgi:hypothetical protein
MKVKVKKQPSETVRRRGALSVLRAKPARPRAPICKCCGCTLVGILEIEPGSGVYDRFCPERDGDMCERTVAR